MKIWLDTANIQAIEKAHQMGLLFGVTTNPSIVAASGRDFLDLLGQLLSLQNGPVTAQVVADTTAEMVDQARMLHSFSSRLVIKIPATEMGFEAIHTLTKEGISTMATVIFKPHQALLAALAGADYVAPYINRMANAGIDPEKALASMTQMFRQHGLKTKILGASIKTIEQVIMCAEMGIHGVTLSDEMFNKLIADEPLTSHAVQQFAENWKVTV